MQSQTSKSQPQDSKDENVALSEQGNQSETTQYSEDPAQVEAILIPHLEKMLELENVKSQNYLVNRLNPNLEIKISLIFKERSVQAITQDYRIIDSALQKCKNIEYLPEIKSIRLKSTVDRKTILVKGIPLAKETDFNKFIDNLCEKDEKTKQYKFSYDKKTECASLTFTDETSTIKIFSELMNTKFQENQIDCIIKDSNAYIEILETTKNFRGGGRGGGMGFGGGYYPYQPGYYPYQPGYYPKQMYNYPPYQQMPMMMPPNNFSTGGYYPGYDKGGWNGGGGYRGNSGYQYRSNKPYYPRKYDKGTEGKFDDGEQGEEGAEKEERTEYRSERREFRGDRRGGRGSFNRRGNYQDKKHHSKEEMEKITSLDPENYPPLS